MTTLAFDVNTDLCTGCESCVLDCPLQVLAMKNGTPAVASERADMCIHCMHCLTICPVGAVSISGFSANDCLDVKGIPDPQAMETLIRARRSTRKYKDENVEPQVMERLLQVAWQAPTGVNARGVLFTVIDDRDTMARLRDEVMDRLEKQARSNSLPEHLKFFAGFVKTWREKGIDTLFRGAPHLILTSAPKSSPCADQDCVIALSYFELYAHTLGLGTVWDGLARWTFTDLMPDLPGKMGIPADHVLGYVMAFGKPDVTYPRTVPLRPAAVNRVKL